ncbi:hypothetical protein D3C80_390220 [compost metagenome]
MVFSTNGYDDRYRIGLKALDHHFAHAEKVSAHAVHFVDERQPRHLVFIGLAPDGFRLRLYATHRVVDHDRAIEHAHRTFDLNGKVYVPGGVDNIDAVLRIIMLHAVPETGRRRRSNGNAAFLLLGHPVHGGGAVVHFAQLVTDPGVKQNPLGGGGFAGIDMRRDADIAVAFEGGST